LRYKDHEIVVCADILYMNNLQTGSILDYTLAYLGAVLARVREKWDQPSKTGLIEITTSREYYRIYSGFQFVSNCLFLVITFE
jgi:cytoplasmic FMR1 interacting protein